MTKGVRTRFRIVRAFFYQRLLAAGKARKLALTAAMRKLLVILNAMLRDRTSWNPDHAAATNLWTVADTVSADCVCSRQGHPVTKGS